MEARSLSVQWESQFIIFSNFPASSQCAFSWRRAARVSMDTRSCGPVPAGRQDQCQLECHSSALALENTAADPAVARRTSEIAEQRERDTHSGSHQQRQALLSHFFPWMKIICEPPLQGLSASETALLKRAERLSHLDACLRSLIGEQTVFIFFSMSSTR